MKTNHTKALATMFMAFALSAASYAGSKTDKTVKIRMIETTDVHGRFFPYDFINQQPANARSHACRLTSTRSAPSTVTVCC